MTRPSGRHTVVCYANDARPGEALYEVLWRRLNTKKDLASELSRLLLGGCHLDAPQLKKILALFDGIWEVDLSRTGLTPAGVQVLAQWYREGGSSLGGGVRPKRLDVSLNGLTADSLGPLLAAVRGLGGGPRWVIVGDVPELLGPSSAWCHMHAPRGCVCTEHAVVHCAREMQPRDFDMVALWERTLPAQRVTGRALALPPTVPPAPPPREVLEEARARPGERRPATVEREAGGHPGPRSEWPSLRVHEGTRASPPKLPPPPPPRPAPPPEGVPVLISSLVTSCTARLAETRARREEAAAAEAAEAAAAAQVAAAAAALLALEDAPRPLGFPNSALVLGRAEDPSLVSRYALLDVEGSLAVGAPTEVGGGALGALRLVTPSPEGWLRAVARNFGGGDYDPRVYLQAKEGDLIEFRLGMAGEFASEEGIAWVAARSLPGPGEEGGASPLWFPLTHCIAPWEG